MLLAKATPNLAALTSSKVNPLPNLNFLLYLIVCSLTIGLKRFAGLGNKFKAAKLGVAFARSIGIVVDHRRKNKSNEAFQVNVKRLTDYKAQLVLFPRHAGKPKKGLVNDATDADVKQFGSIQVTDVNTSLPVHQQAKREKPVKITKEMKEAKVYKKLRLERTNAYYAGKREKKAKEAAAK